MFRIQLRNFGYPSCLDKPDASGVCSNAGLPA